MLLPPIAINAIINASIILSWGENIQLSYICKACEPIKCHSLNAQFFGCFETIASKLMAFKFLCTTLGKYCKFPLGIQRPIVNNELSKERCATCKGRKSVMLFGYMHTYNQELIIFREVTERTNSLLYFYEYY